jgi:hypothetical protein
LGIQLAKPFHRSGPLRAIAEHLEDARFGHPAVRIAGHLKPLPAAEASSISISFAGITTTAASYKPEAAIHLTADDKPRSCGRGSLGMGCITLTA